MAGTSVRSLRESFVSTGAQLATARALLGSHIDRGMERELVLLAFVAVQAITCGILIMRGALDLGIAACLSAGLILAAGVYASRRAALMAGDRGRGVTRDQMISALVEADALDSAPIAPATAAVHDRVQASQAWADLMARISHEIRTPLNAVIGFSDLMDREIFGPLGHSRYAGYAGHIKDSGEALLKSAEDTLALSSLLAAPKPCERPQITNLSELVCDAWRPLAEQAERRGLMLEAGISGQVEVAGERRVIRQALLNLMNEALNRAADGGSITVEARMVGDTVRLSIATVTGSSFRHETMPSLAVCLARALLERTGTALLICDDPGRRTWRAISVLDLPVQDDFFGC